MKRSGLWLCAFGVVASTALGDAAKPSQPRTPFEAIRELDRLDTQDRVLVAKIESVTPTIEALDRSLALKARSYHRRIHAGMLPATLGHASLAQHMGALGRLRVTLTRDLEQRAALLEERTRAATALAAVREERGPLELSRQALQLAQGALSDAADRASSFSESFAPDNLLYGGDIPVSPASGFVMQKGKLLVPIAGRTDAKKVRRPGAGGAGIEFSAAHGSTVRAASGGRIAFADAYAEHGLTIIVDHGEGYFTLYGGLGERTVEVGDQVGAGTPIGKAATRGAQPRIYVEVRHDADTIDASPWFGL